MSHEPDLITRREAIQRVSLLLGTVTFVGGSALLTACERERPATVAGGSVGTFTTEDIALLDEVAETILPETKTPGAKAAKTGAFMALMVTDTYDARDQKIFRDGMRALDEESRKANGGASFISATPQQRLALLERLDRDQKSINDAREAARRKAEGHLPDQRQEAAPGGDGGGAAGMPAHPPKPPLLTPPPPPPPPRDGDHRRHAQPLLPHDEGARAARLLHVGDRLHAGAALRRVAGPLRSVRPVRAG
jgi:hypothetical protein